MLDPQILAEFAAALGPPGVSTDIVDRLACSHDTYPLALKLADSDQAPPWLPDLVAFPQDTIQVAAAVRIAAAHRIPLFAYGGGSGIVGGALASPGGVTLELKRLAGIHEFDPLSNLVTAGAGTNGQLLEDALNARGRTLGHYPQSLRSSTVGGWVAHRATGTASTLYGGIEQLVVGLEVVLPDGEILGLRASPRSATGPDLHQLFLGSEGTLGVITRVALRVFPLPAERRWLAFTFANFVLGLDAVRRAVQAGCRPVVVRLYDELEGAHLLESSARTASHVGRCLLFLSCEGSPARVDWESAQIEASLRESGGDPISTEPAERWWSGRFNTRGLLASLRAPLGIADALEVSAPWRLLPDLYSRMRARMQAALGLPERPGQVYGHCSHVYPDGGNLYMIFHGQASDPASLPGLYRAVLDAAFEACAEVGGSLSHHHGIGLGKSRYLGLELGPAGLEMLRAVQRAVDPPGILNRGSWEPAAMLETHAEFLHRCTVCHDQCLFATTEVFASGRMALATSRKAMLVQAVRRGQLDWTPAVVEVVYSGLSSGVQHAVCVDYGDPAGWSDETLYLRAARAEIVRAGRAPAWAQALRDAWQASGNPYGLPDGPDLPPRAGEPVFLFDAATRAFQPAAVQAWLEAARRLGLDIGVVQTGCSGFELFDLGFEPEAREAAARLAGTLRALGARQVVSDSPEAVYMLRRVWPEWGMPLDFQVLHASQWLATLLADRDLHSAPAGELLTYQDPSCLGRYLGETEAPRQALDRLGVRRVEMIRSGAEALPAGSYYGELPGAWVGAVSRARCADALAVEARGIITASPFDFHSLSACGGLPVFDLGRLAAERLTLSS